MHVASARMYIAMLSVMSLHNASAPAWILLRNNDVIGACLHDCLAMLQSQKRWFSWLYKQHPLTLIGTTMPCETTTPLIVTMNITSVFYLHPPVHAHSNIILQDAGIVVRRLLLI